MNTCYRLSVCKMDEFQYEYYEGEIYKTLIKSTTESGSKKPHDGTTCIVEFSNVHKENTLSSSSYLDKIEDTVATFPITIGVSSVTQIDRLIDVCLTKMNSGETSSFILKCNDGDVQVKFTASLLSYDDFPHAYILTDERKLDVALQLKNDGVQLFKSNRNKDAFHKFSKALKYIILLENDELRGANSNLKLTLQCNMAGCHVVEKNWKYALDLCNKVLQKDSDNVKALYRRGYALMELNEFDRSKIDLSRAITLEPSNKSIKSKLLLLNDRIKTSNAELALFMQKMFN